MSGILSCMNTGENRVFSSDSTGYDRTNIPLTVKGQCIFAFYVQPGQPRACFDLCCSDTNDGLQVLLTEQSVIIKRMSSGETYIDKDNTSGIEHVDGIYYWISLDSQNQRIFVGVGEARIDTHKYHYQFPWTDPSSWHTNKLFMESISKLSIEDPGITPHHLLKNPIDVYVPLMIKGTHELSMDDIAEAKYLPSANLASVSRMLYGCVSGKKFVLDDESFPDFTKAIEHSIATPGCWCYETLQSKKDEFNPDVPNIKETYLRITLGDNDGDSPGIPYVLEIWPVGHYSPIHNHADADAIIRVLHGNINVSLYPFLSDDPDEVPPFGVADFKKDDVTWLGGGLNQTHKLKNLDDNDQTCITIQCYMYSKADNKHYDYFDYVGGDGKIEQYEPDSDKDFVAFKQKMREEWGVYCEETAARTSCYDGYWQLPFPMKYM